MTTTEPRMWTTREGKKIPIQELGDTHLVNCIKMIVRKLDMMRACEMVRTLYALSAAREKWGDIDDDDEEDIGLRSPHQLDRSFEKELKPDNMYFALIAEAEGRGLDWEPRGVELKKMMAFNELKILNSVHRAKQERLADKAHEDFLNGLSYYQLKDFLNPGSAE